MPFKQRGEEPERNHQEYPGWIFEYDSKEQVLTNWTQYDPAQIYEMANYIDNMVMCRRHNNGLESSHRRTRKAIRERTDTAQRTLKRLIGPTWDVLRAKLHA